MQRFRFNACFPWSGAILVGALPRRFPSLHTLPSCGPSRRIFASQPIKPLATKVAPLLWVDRKPCVPRRFLDSSCGGGTAKTVSVNTSRA